MHTYINYDGTDRRRLDATGMVVVVSRFYGRGRIPISMLMLLVHVRSYVVLPTMYIHIYICIHIYIYIYPRSLSISISLSSYIHIFFVYREWARDNNLNLKEVNPHIYVCFLPT